MQTNSSPPAQSRRSSRRRRRAKHAMADINMTPFIDIMLVLLIVFMVAAPLLTVGVPVDLPESKAPELPAETRPLTLTVTQSGELFVSDVPVTEDTLIQAIINQADKNGLPTPQDQRLLIRADKTVDYGNIMRVMGALADQGFSKIGLITEKER